MYCQQHQQVCQCMSNLLKTICRVSSRMQRSDQHHAALCDGLTEVFSTNRSGCQTDSL